MTKPKPKELLKQRGRPTDYSDDLATEFCRRVASGRSVLSVCADLDMPSDTTAYRWRQEKPEFRDKLALARDERLEAYSDQIRALGNRVVDDESFDPQRCNAAVNAIDKAARLQAPKQRIEMTGKDGAPIEHALVEVHFVKPNESGEQK